MKTLVIASHPYPEQSLVIKALQKAVGSIAEVEVRNLEALYGSDLAAFDVAAEQKACERADRIVHLFPIHWFNLTPMLKAYMNQVWSYGWAFGPDGKALKGKELLAVVTAGASEFTYSAEGLVQSSMDEVLTPLRASALYVGMRFAKPLAFFEAMGADEGKLAGFSKVLAARLAQPVAATIS
ncbi:NAD(P)H-dependent oxidoreductase [Pectobacterium quasiaquaticum]|uniref:NAD(P)H-dependent oxidoreductase n=1 Tax=Pectobacterium quasiaquaticum TaxID=2774015 RepID=A0A9Q2I970_9GAMM|nr:NAD(P)H-dependent oxidoreductase [Pectobacterium quasiaquaticum]URG49308.1 NAD(P)H-dependent oxidoreductase [Pectobacterium quasiaquaticum]